MNYELLDQVALTHDIPEHGLRAGDLGTVVFVYDPDGLEVEFMTASGETNAVLTLHLDDVRGLRDGDVYAVRTFEAPVRG